MTQPPREDERLTNTSIPSCMRVTPGSFSTALNDSATASTLHARKLANVEKQATSKIESRRDALHTLYMNACTFITTEKQLTAEIDRVFDDPKLEWGDAASDGESIWNKQPPATIATLLQEGTGRSERAEVGSAIHRGETQRYRTDQKRMKRIAEVLSGGKM